MAIKVSGTTVINDSRKGIFSRLNPGVYTNSNRPNNPNVGDLIYNSEEEELQVWDGTEWTSAGGGSGELSSVTLAPLSGTPNYEITAVTDISSIPAGATANYKWYRYDEATGNAGKTLIVSVDSDQTSDVYTANSLDQLKYIGCTVTYLGTNESEEARSAASEASVPIATMHGLRFNTTAAPYLYRSGIASNSSSFTYSGWLKQFPVAGGNQYFLTNGTGSGEGQGYFLGSDNKYQIATSGAPQALTDVITNLGEWNHLVITGNGSSTTAYLNGVEAQTVNFYINITDPFLGAAWLNNLTSNFNGYMSEVYFVDGQVLEPTAFGKQFLLGWGPLDSTAILDNIGSGVYSPWDTRANMEQTWSAGSATAQLPDAGWAGAFNGDDNTASHIDGATQTEETLTFTTPIPFSGSCHVKVSCPTGAGVANIKINGIAIPSDAYTHAWGGDVKTEVGEYLTGETQIESITLGKSSDSEPTHMYMMWVNGRELRDGPANNSQNWSAITNNGSLAYSNEYANSNAFNGTTTIATGTSSLPADGVTMTLPLTSIEQITKVEIVPLNSAATGEVSQYTLGELTFPAKDLAYNAGWQTLYDGSARTFADFTWQSVDFDGDYAGLVAIRINDEILIDSGAQWDTSQVWSSNVTTDSPTMAAPITDSFNGNHSNRLYVQDSNGYTNYQLFFDPPIGNGVDDDVEILWSSEGSYTAQPRVNGLTVTPTNGVWQRIPATNNNTGYQIQSIACTHAVNVGATSPTAIRVNGIELVDPPSFGPNGFYLPFDPEATAYVYSNGRITGSPFDGTYRWLYAFNGVIAPPSDGRSNGASGAGTDESNKYTLYLPNISFEKLTLHVSNNSSTIWVNETPFLTSAAVNVGTSMWDLTITKDQLGNVPLQSLAILQTLTLMGVSVDGVLLLDHTAAGVDASGNNNDFQDQNFNAGNTSQVWSSGTIKSSWADLVPVTNLFDGDLSTYTYAKDTGSYVNVSWPAITANHSICVYGRGTTNSWRVIINGSPVSVPFTGNELADNNWINIPVTYPCEITGIENNNPGAVYAITVDTLTLIDGNIADLVDDTPMTSYATFDSENVGAGFTFTDGNLETAQSSGWFDCPSTLATVPSGKYYYEFRQNYGTSNLQFGWRAETTTAGNPDLGTSGVVYKDITGDAQNTTSGSFTYGDAWAFPDVVATVLDYDTNTVTYFNNGVSQGVAWSDVEAIPYYPFVSLYESSGVINFGQHSFAANNVTDNGDGTVTVDAPYNDPYLSRNNMAQPFSAGTVLSGTPWNGTYNFTALFDGTVDSVGASPADSTPYVLEFPQPLPVGETIAVQMATAEQAGFTWYLNGVEIQGTGTNPCLYTKEQLGITEIVSIGCSQQITMVAVYVDGRLLVDGPANNSGGTWAITTVVNGQTGSFNPGGGLPEAMFNYKYGSYYGPVYNGSEVLVTWNQPLTGELSVMAFIDEANNETSGYTINHSGGSTFYSAASLGLTVAQNQISSIGTFTDITSIEIIFFGGNSGLYTMNWYLDGEALVDGPTEWNTSQIWSGLIDPEYTTGFGGSAKAMFNGVIENGGEGWTNNYITASGPDASKPIFVENMGNIPCSTLSAWCYQGLGTIPVFNINGQPATCDNWIGDDASHWAIVNLPAGVSTLNSFKFNLTPAQGRGGQACGGLLVDGKLLVDSSNAGGPMVCKKLFGTWTEQQAQFFNSELKRLGNYEAALRSVAAAYDANGSYDEGAIVSHDGELWQAVANGAEAVTPATSASVTWKQLGLSS